MSDNLILMEFDCLSETLEVEKFDRFKAIVRVLLGTDSNGNLGNAIKDVSVTCKTYSL